MARQARTAIEIGTNEAPAVAGLKRLVSEFANASTKINQSLELAGKAWGAITGSISTVVNLVSEYVKLSETQLRAEKQLEAALKMRGEYSRAAMTQTKALASEMQGLTTIGDGTTIAVQAQMLAMGVSVSRMREATEAAIGLSSVTGSLESAAKMVAKTITSDNVAALRKLGIEARDTDDALAKMRDMMALQKAEAETLTGRWTQLQNAIDSGKVVIGEGVSRSESLNEALVALTRATEDFTALLSGPAGVAAVNAFFQAISGGVADAINAYLGFKKLVYGDQNEPEWMTRARGVGNLVTAGSGLFNPLMWFVGDSMGDFSDAIDQIRGINNASMSEAESMLQDLADRMQAARRKAAKIFEDPFAEEEFTPATGDGLGGLPEIPGVERMRAAAAAAAERAAAAEQAAAAERAFAERERLSSQEKKLREEQLRDEQEALELERELIRYKNESRKIAEADATRHREIMIELELQRLRDEQEAVDERNLLLLNNFNTMEDLRFAEITGMQRAYKTMDEMRLAERAANAQHFNQLKTTVVTGLAGMTGSIVGNLIAGGDQVKDAGKAFFGGLLSLSGQMMTQLGAAALAAAIGSKAVPWLWPIFGGPIGVAGAAGIIAAGATLSAVGSALSSSARGAAGGASAAAVGDAAPRLPDFGRGFQEPAAAAGEGYTVIVNFNGIVTDPRRTAREIADVQRRAR